MTNEQMNTALCSAWESAKKKFNAKYVEEVKKIVNECVDDFYSSYTPKPNRYKRKNDLMDVLSVKKYRGYYTEIILDENRLAKHRYKNSYIYDITFHEGWHGGAPKGEGHPEVGVPYYRTPPPNFTEWGEPAETTTPIFDNINKRVKKLNKNINNMWNNILILELRRNGLV